MNKRHAKCNNFSITVVIMFGTERSLRLNYKSDCNCNVLHFVNTVLIEKICIETILSKHMFELIMRYTKNGSKK